MLSSVSIEIYTYFMIKSKISDIIDYLFLNEINNLAELAPLSPNEHEDHKEYVQWLDTAIQRKKPKMYNIALAGGYGSGKSSILRQFAGKKKKRTVWVSFGTLQEIGSSENITNNIQKEIVKQLVFKEKPTNIPHSKYDRVHKPSYLKVLLLSILTGFFVVLLFYKFFGTDLNKLIIILAPNDYIKYQYYIGWISFSAITVIAIYLIIYYLGCRLNVDKFGNNSLNLSFTKTNVNYFDQYIDEIVYFFEATKYDIVIFEDIDRFENHLIFEQLRQLNILLNNSSQISRHRDIRFIYAVKDSIFSNTIDASASRTKFFDLIIPIVPFITFENASKYFKNNFPDIDMNIIKIVSRNITDMRQIINIRNEFVVFSNKLLIENSELKLEPNKLFALIVYKNIYLEDFENIKNLDSDLEKIYGEHRKNIKLEIVDIENKILMLKESIEQGLSLDKKVSELSGKMVAFIEMLKNETPEDIFVKLSDNVGQDINEENFLDLGFWKAIEDASSTDIVLKLEFTVSFQQPGYSSFRQIPHIRIITKAFLVKYFNDDIDLSKLSEQKIDNVTKDIVGLSCIQEQIKHSTISAHLKLSENYRVYFNQLLEHKGLARSLIEEGYIDDFFIYYYATYNSTLKPNALRFKYINIFNNIMDINYELDDMDIKEILEDIDPVYYGDFSMYNIDIVEYLVKNKDFNIDRILNSISQNPQQGAEFVLAYAESQKMGISSFISLLSKSYKNIFKILTVEGALDRAYRNKLINYALVNSSNISYDFDDTTIAYIASEQSSIYSLSKNLNSSNSDAINAMNVIAKMDVKLNLSNLNLFALNLAIQNNSYEISPDNLKVIFPNIVDASLDQIRVIEDRKSVYDYMLNNLEKYLSTIIELDNIYSISGKDGFESVVNDIIRSDPTQLTKLIEYADGSNSIIEDIDSLDKSAWDVIMSMQTILIQSTFGNVLKYYNYSQDEQGALDTTLVCYLELIDGMIHLDKEYDDYDEAARKNFVRDFMNSKNIETQIKVNLVKSIYENRDTSINIKFFDLQEGDIYGKLLAEGLLSDVADSYKHIQGQSWETKEIYLKNSVKAVSYIDEISLTDDELDNISLSNVIGDEIKLKVLEIYINEPGRFSDEATKKMADFSLAINKKLPAKVIENFARRKVAAPTIVGLTNLIDRSTSIDEIRSIFANVADSELSKIAKSKYKPLIADNEDNRRLLLRLFDLGMIKNMGKNIDDKIRLFML